MKTPSQELPKSVFFALFSVLFLVILSFTLSLMAGIYIVSELGGSNYISTYSVSFFSIGNALGIPLGVVLWPRFGVIRLMIHCLLLFAFFSWLCGASSTFFIFVGARFFQGFVTGPLYALLTKTVGHLVPDEKKYLSTATFLTIFSIAPVIGASWGGVIAYLIHWSWPFYLNVILILFIAWFLRKHLKDYDAVWCAGQKNEKFDWIGYLCFSLAIFSLGFVLTTGQEFDWHRSHFLVALTIVGVLSGVFFVLWERVHPHPLFELSLIKRPILIFALFNLATLFSAYFGMVILLSLWLKLFVQYTPFWIGVLIGIMGITALFPSILLHKKWGFFDARLALIIAIGFLAISSFHTALFNEEINFGRVALSRLFAGLGLAFFLTPIFRLAFRNFPEEKGLNVLMYFQVVRALSSGLGAALYTILWQRREVFYYERLGGQLTPFSQLTDNYFSRAGFFGLNGAQATSELDVLLQRQAYALALEDCFYLMGWLLIGLLVLVAISLFLRDQRDFFPEKKALEKRETV